MSAGRRVRWALRALRALALGASLAGCGGASTVTDERPVAPDYEARVLARVEAAAKSKHFDVRLNPAQCGCPPHEIALEGRWHRARVELASDEDDALRLALAAAWPGGLSPAAARDTPALRLVGELAAGLERCGRGTLVVVFAPTELVD